MPEFIMNTEGQTNGIAFDDLDAFARGYIEAMFFTESSAWSKAEIQDDPEGWAEAEREGVSDGTIPSDSTFGDIAPDSLARIMQDCTRFQDTASNLLREAYSRDYDAAQAGRDFWFTRNGHGVGFWDRQALDAGSLGDNLSALCRHQEQYVCIGDDGMIHVG